MIGPQFCNKTGLLQDNANEVLNRRTSTLPRRQPVSAVHRRERHGPATAAGPAEPTAKNGPIRQTADPTGPSDLVQRLSGLLQILPSI